MSFCIFKALGMLTVNDLKTYFFPEGEHETFLKMNNSEQDDVLLTLSDKKVIMLSEVKEDEGNTFYRNLNWQFQLAGKLFLSSFPRIFTSKIGLSLKFELLRDLNKQQFASNSTGPSTAKVVYLTGILYTITTLISS